MADRYFVDSPLAEDRAVLTGAEAHHVVHVMRAKVGDELLLFDGSGIECLARVDQTARSTVQCTIVSRQQMDREMPLAVTLGVALPKGDRQRWLVEKAVELGVMRLVPIITARGVAQPTDKGLQRLRRTVIEASKQCGRNRLMAIAEAQSWEQFVTESSAARRLVAHPGGEPIHAIAAPPANHAADLRLAVGPEGGFTNEEIQLASHSGWQLVDLGPRILRIETAAVLLVSLGALTAVGCGEPC